MYKYEIDEKLDELVREAYTLFAKYKVQGKLNVCSCCVSDDEALNLTRTPLHLVSRALLEKSYYASVYCDTDEDLDEMKHFLPRVLDLMLNDEFPCHSNELVFSRINLRDKERWTEEELELLKKFSVLYFKKVLNGFSLFAEDVLVMFGIGNFDLSFLLTEWEDGENETMFSHLFNLLNTGVCYKFGEISKLSNVFRTKETNESIIKWLNNDLVMKKFSKKIEEMLLDDNLNLDEETWFELDLLYSLLIGRVK